MDFYANILWLVYLKMPLTQCDNILLKDTSLDNWNFAFGIRYLLQ